MRRAFIFIATIALALNALCQTPIAGTWHGDIQINVNKLPVVIHIFESDDGYAATLDSPLQGAKDIECEFDIESDTIVSFNVPSIGASYKGIYRGEEIAGKFTQSGMTFPLNFLPGDIQRPQTPVEPYPYPTESVRFFNPNDSAMLCGRLTLPVTYRMPLTKDVPLVVMVTGSGQQNRDEEIFRHKPFAVLAHHLALNGIASLRYDDRGFGESTGNVENATTNIFASDAEAAIDYVRSNVKKIGKIGVLGHSEGGTIAFMLGAKGKADFIVSLAGAAVSGKDILLSQNEKLMKGAFSDETIADYIEALKILFAFIESHPDTKECSAIDNSISSLINLTPQLKDNLKAIAASNIPWLSHFISYDPAQDISKVRCPTLAINGTLDAQVDCSTNLNVLRSLLPANEQSVVKEYPGLNHLFQHATTGMPSEYGDIDETISPEVISDIIKWINALSK